MDASDANFFDSGSPYLNHPLLTADRTSNDVAAVESILQLKPDDMVLDVGCGFGRHSDALARRGYNVTGIDPSPTMIEEARARWQPNPATLTTPSYEVGTVDQLSADVRFDGAVCLFTTLGQVGPDGLDNTPLVEQVKLRLTDSGAAIFEVPNRRPTVANLVESDRFETELGSTDISRAFDATTSRVAERFIVSRNGNEAIYNLCYRIMDSDELQDLLTGAGFKDIALFPSLNAAAEPSTSAEYTLSDSDPTIVAVARARSQASN